ncbi:hypothetical protein LTR56_017192 [Elasticomyces elasticus]|nr:hypothetical protein LTR56_017192 [Elasticomyces elasticus]KAK3666308.1 hypothetical protein LTR22_002972 [Elasticomyces elasticus]KAK4926904.1 hypothetical protein LTR49_006320 [Elasticomyces elasticus]KAK5752665.1 hypothetical protein LTS12_017234 [Elasticomyces elasticus]
MASCSQALAVPELLENMLLQLPIRDLLFAQKVCTEWKDVIDTSPSIQRALFLKPGTPADVDPKWTGRDRHLCGHDGKAVAPNPLLLARRAVFVPHHIIRQDVLETEERSSCHCMYITQPPVAIRAEFRQSRYACAWEGETFGHLADRYFALEEDRFRLRRSLYGMVQVVLD